MGSRCLAMLFVLFLTCQVSAASIFEPLLGCRCAREKSSFIPSSRYASVSVYPPGSVCKRMEIIIMLKNGTKVCVDPKANWVQHLVEIIRSMKKAASSS